MSIIIPVTAIEFYEDGRTIWIHGPHGGTVMRIKCTGKIITNVCDSSPISHNDITVEGDIHFCLSKDAIKNGTSDM